jgi:hypothetical protein
MNCPAEAQQPRKPEPPSNPPRQPEPDEPQPVEEPPEPVPVPGERDEPTPMEGVTREFARGNVKHDDVALIEALGGAAA